MHVLTYSLVFIFLLSFCAESKLGSGSIPICYVHYSTTQTNTCCQYHIPPLGRGYANWDIMKMRQKVFRDREVCPRRYRRRYPISYRRMKAGDRGLRRGLR
jgi:hypothetical protein